MKITLSNEQAIIHQAMQILSQTMAPSQILILISRYWSEGGDYLKQRDELFANATVDSLVQEIQAYEYQNPN